MEEITPTPEVANPQSQEAMEGAQGQAREQESFWKGDPTKLPEELRQVYRGMQADYTRKTQQLAEERKKWEGQLQELTNTLKYYQQLLPYLGGVTGQQPTQEAAREEKPPTWDPLDENSVRAYVSSVVENYAKRYAGNMQRALEWQWYVTAESMRLARKYPEFDLQQVMRYAPHYNWNLETTAKALYETKKRYEEAERASELAKKVEALEKALQEARKGSSAFVMNGTSRPYRPPANPKEYRTLQDVAASIPLESVLSRDE